MTHEFDLVNTVRRSVTQSLPAEVVGIGDDCAVWRCGGSALLLATDMLVENVHFTLADQSLRQIGRKAVAVNLSDIAAMAGIPETIMVSLALPLHTPLHRAEELMSGMLDIAQEFETLLIGGDTTVHAGPLVVNVAVTGRCTAKGPVLRSGARAGDAIFVTGPLGGSILNRHWSFTPRVREALRLHELADLHAMIDISDGLASDIRHIARESGVGCVLQADRIPISEAARQTAADRSPLEHALSDGEDFELLFTVSSEDAERLRQQSEIPLYEIGETVDDPQTVLLNDADGRVRDLPDTGWKHMLD